MSRVVPADRLREEAVAVTEVVAEGPQPVVAMARECVDRGPVQATFHRGQKGMGAFVAGQAPAFRHR